MTKNHVVKNAFEYHLITDHLSDFFTQPEQCAPWSDIFWLDGHAFPPAGFYRLEMAFSAKPDKLLPRLSIHQKDGRQSTIILPPAAAPGLSVVLHLPEDCIAIAFSPAPWPVTFDPGSVMLRPQTLPTRIGEAIQHLRARISARGINGLRAGARRWLLTRFADIHARLQVEGLHGLLCNPRTRWHRSESPVTMTGRDWFYSQLPDAATSGGLAAQAEKSGALEDCVILTAPGAEIQPHAAARLALARQQANADLAYGDEMEIVEGAVWPLRARTAFSHDAFLFDPDLGGVVAVSRRLAQQMGLADDSPLTANVLLRLIGHARVVCHVPEVICLRTQQAISTNRASASEIQYYLDRLRRPIRLEAETAYGFDIRGPAEQPWKAGIVVPTRNGLSVLSKCVAAIERTCDPERYHLMVVDHESDDPATLAYLADIRRHHSVIPYHGPFNFSAINNHAVRHLPADCNLLVMMNNDVEAVSADWLSRLAETALREDVGVVGPLLLYPDRRVQHAGMVLGLYGLCDHVAKWLPAEYPDGSRNPGPMNMLCAIRDCSALTGACLVLKRTLYDRLGGLDENLVVGYNDVDLCLRLREQNQKVLFDGRVVMIHHESVSRGTSHLPAHPVDTARFRHRYRQLVAAGDPFFSPLLSLDHQTPTPRQPYQAVRPAEPRTTRLPPWELR